MCSSLLLFFRRGHVSFPVFALCVPNRRTTQPKLRPQRRVTNHSEAPLDASPSILTYPPFCEDQLNTPSPSESVGLPTTIVPRTTVSHPIVTKYGHKFDLFPLFSRRISQLSSTQHFFCDSIDSFRIICSPPVRISRP